MKKREWISFTTMIVFMMGACVVADAQSRPDFSGTWALDLKRATEKPPDLKSYVLIVKQDGQQISVESKVEGDPNPVRSEHADSHAHAVANAAGAPGGAASLSDNVPGNTSSRVVQAPGRALAMVVRRMNCTMDGKEVSRDVTGLSPGKMRRKAIWRKDEKTLEINLARDFDSQKGTITSTVKELWTLSDDGKSLRIKRTVNLLAGWDETTLVFTRQ
jgi:hypothetical protein